MPTGSYRRATQKIARHNSNDTGRATITPRANPRLGNLRTKAGLPSRSSRFSTLASVVSSIIPEIILLSGKFDNLVAFFGPLCTSIKTRRSGARKAERSRPFAASSGVFSQLADVLTILRIAGGETASPQETAPPVIYVASGRGKNARRNLVHLSTTLFVLYAQGRTAHAQDDGVVTPIEMFTAESGQGIKLANELDLNLQASLEGVYDNNVYDTAAQRRSDTIGVFRPVAQLVTRIPRHELRLQGNAEIRRHANLTGENSEQYGLLATGLLELGGRIDVIPEAGYARRIERRGTAGDQFLTDSPIAYHEKRFGLQIARTGGTLEASFGGSISKNDYIDSRVAGLPVDLSSRDVLVRRANVRASLAISEPTRVFAELAGNQVRYEQRLPNSRDSSGFGVLVGGQVEVAKLIKAEAGIGYIRQKFADPTIRPVSGVNYWVSGQWTPTPQWQLTAKGQKQIEPSPRTDTPAIVRSTFSLNAKRAIGDRMLLDATVSILSENYWQIPRKDHSYSAALSGHYRLTGAIGLVTSVGYRKRTSRADPTARYDGFDIRFGVNAKW